VAASSGVFHALIVELTAPHRRLSLEGHSDWVSCLGFSPDGTRLASGSQDRIVRLWDVTNGDLLLRLEGLGDTVSHVAFSPDGAHLAAAGADGRVRIWHAWPLPPQSAPQGVTPAPSSAHE